MNIAFFEIEEWEVPYIKDKLASHTLTFDPEPFSLEKATGHKDTEILSVFIYSSLTRETIDALPSLKMIVTRSTGTDHIDVSYCKQKNIIVCNVPEYGTHTVAEHTFALLLSLSRKLVPSIERTRRGDFSLEGLRGFDLFGKTIGIIGVGNIGKSVIRIANGFGMDVIAYARHPDVELAHTLRFTYVDLDHLLATSDVVTLHVPYTKETHHMINKENLGRFKKGSILLNTARGGLVETEAILLGLEQGIFAGVGIDVLEEEFGIKEERQLLTKNFLQEHDIKTQLLNHVLLNKENVIVTPHNAFNSREALQRILEVTVQNISDFVMQNPKNIV